MPKLIAIKNKAEYTETGIVKSLLKMAELTLAKKKTVTVKIT